MTFQPDGDDRGNVTASPKLLGFTMKSMNMAVCRNKWVISCRYVELNMRRDERGEPLWFQTDLWSWSYLESGGDSVMETGPAGHIGRDINVPTVQIHHRVPRRSSTCRETRELQGKRINYTNTEHDNITAVISYISPNDEKKQNLPVRLSLGTGKGSVGTGW